MLSEIHYHQNTTKFKLSKKDIAKCFEVVFEILKKNKSVNVLKSILLKLETFCAEESWRFMKLRSELQFFLGEEKNAISSLKLSTVSLLFSLFSLVPSVYLTKPNASVGFTIFCLCNAI